MSGIREFWRRRGIWNRALAPLAALFGVVVALRRGMSRRGLPPVKRVRAAVVVVGGIVAGGGGKTPLTIALARALRRMGKRPGVVSRGYGASPPTPRLVGDDPAVGEDPALCGDEPVLIRRQTGLPVCVCRARAKAAAMLADLGCDVIISDDGLQHRALARDLEIAVVDSVYLLGNRMLLPAGPLRERPARLAECDAVVVRDYGGGGAEVALAEVAADKIFRIRMSAGRLYRIARPEDFIDPRRLAGKKIAAIAAIAAPESFFATLRRLGLELSRTVALPDHAAIPAAALAAPDADFVVMTEKDAVKCDDCGDDRLLALSLKIHGVGALARFVAAKIDGRQTA